MKRLLMVLALAGFAVACGDDDETKPTVDGGGQQPDGSRPDTGVPDASGIDSGGGGAKVATTGVACTSASTCGGSASECRTTLWDVATAPATPGGYCSATCTTDADCGGGGVCPLGGVIGFTMGRFGAAAKCHQGCMTVGSPTGCRTGYVCQSVKSLADATGSGAAVPSMAPWTTGFCYPIPADAGVPDAGPRDGGADAGGMDSGVGDAGFDAAG